MSKSLNLIAQINAMDMKIRKIQHRRAQVEEQLRALSSSVVTAESETTRFESSISYDLEREIASKPVAESTQPGVRNNPVDEQAPTLTLSEKRARAKSLVEAARISGSRL